MARVPMVTRTIVTTKVNVMCLDTQKGEPFNESVTVPRTYKDDEVLLLCTECQSRNSFSMQKCFHLETQ